MKHFKIMAFAVAAAALLAATGVQARELVYGAWVSPKHGVMVDALPHMFKGVAKDTNGAVTWKLVAGGQLVKGKNTLAGIRDGLIDAGLAISVFTPKNVPSTAILHSTLIAGNDNVAVTAAQNETVLLDCPSCTAEWKVNNAVYLAGYAPTPFKLMCRDKITNLKELKGKKVRVTGGSVQLMKMAGATPVSMTPAEATTALQRGTIDCVLGAVAWLKSYGYQDVAKHLIDYPLGVIGPAVSVAINRKTWLGMTDAQRKAHIKYMPMVVAQSALSAYLFRDNAILADAIKVGVTVHKAGPEFDALMAKRDAMQDGLNIKRYTGFGLKDAKGVLAAYKKNLAKWNKLSKVIGKDVDKMAAAVKREIYDKLDLSKL